MGVNPDTHYVIIFESNLIMYALSCLHDGVVSSVKLYKQIFIYLLYM